MKIGIFGGSFNPVHTGHIKLIECAQNKFIFDKFYIVPCGIQPLKGTLELSPEIRLNLLKEAMKNCVPNIEISDYEINKTDKSYAIDTVEYFMKLHLRCELYLIMGTDSFALLEKWMRFEDLIKSCRFVVVKRMSSALASELDLLDKIAKSHPKLTYELVDFDLPEISSTVLRNRDNDR